MLRLGFVGDLAALVGQRRLKGVRLIDLAQRARRRDMQRRVGIGDLEQIFGRRP